MSGKVSIESGKQILKQIRDSIYKLSPKRYPYLCKYIGQDSLLRKEFITLLNYLINPHKQVNEARDVEQRFFTAYNQYCFFMDTNAYTSKIRNKRVTLGSRERSNHALNIFCALGFFDKDKNPDNYGVNLNMKLNQDRNRDMTIYHFKQIDLDQIEKEAKRLFEGHITVTSISAVNLRATGLGDIANRVYNKNKIQAFNKKLVELDVILRILEDLINEKGYCTKGQLISAIPLKEKEAKKVLRAFRSEIQSKYKYGKATEEDKEKYKYRATKWIYTRRENMDKKKMEEARLEKKRKKEVERYNALFDELITDSELGLITVEEEIVKRTYRDIKDDNGNIINKVRVEGREGRVYSDWIKTPISRTIERDGKTIDYYKMAYADLDKDDIFYLCRRQLPRNWFVCRNGEVLEYKNKAWYWRKNKKDDRKILEIFKNKKYPNGRLYTKQYDTYKTKLLPPEETIDGTHLESHVLTGIVFGARVFGEKTKQIIKEKGLLAFLAKNEIEGHHTRGYRKDKDFVYSYEENMEYNNNPDYMLFITKEFHKQLCKLILGLNSDITEEELKIFTDALTELLENENPDYLYLIIPYTRDKNFKEIPLEELENYHFYIGEKIKGITKIQVSADDYRYVDIFQYPKEENKDFLNYLQIRVYLEINGINSGIEINIGNVKYKIWLLTGTKEAYLEFLHDMLIEDKASYFKAKVDGFLSGVEKVQGEKLNTCNLSIGANFEIQVTRTGVIENE